jgi:N-acetyl sugar amidotransferase
MDNSDPHIEFDDEGNCNHCTNHLKVIKRWENVDKENELKTIVAQIKEDGKGKKYDCVIGVSGGVDSTYVAFKVKKLGLRPLAVHLDNGWNSELAVNNIQKALEILDIDLHTCVLNWEEFRDIQLAILKASTPDSEIPTDHAIRAVLQQACKTYDVNYILNGRNYVTEGISPWAWTYSALDWKYIKETQKIFGEKKIREFPHFNLLQLLWNASFRRVKQISILNYIEFSKQDAMEVLKNKLGWRSYGGKHHESIYTRFFQSFILPSKFGYDKRKSYMSVLVITGQITREEALKLLEQAPCPENLIREDRIYVSKKLGISDTEFQEIMDSPLKTYADYSNNGKWLYLHNNPRTINVIKILKKLRILPKHFAGNLVPMK